MPRKNTNAGPRTKAGGPGAEEPRAVFPPPLGKPKISRTYPGSR